MEDSNLRNFGTVSDPTGSHQLSLIYVVRELEAQQNGYDFHSLLWEEKINNNWREKILITREQFESNSNITKWISELYSIDPNKGHAIIQVAEGDKPKGSVEIHFNYTWRKWDLINNKEICVLKECEDPFDSYEDK